ncbi:hypothetical protein BC332_18570 [Capsicum chinense]|nr:hypothetical protein BC332_18570 [Capsicum chinense]
MSMKSKCSIVKEDEPKKMHWLDKKKDGRNRSETRFSRGHDRGRERSDVSHTMVENVRMLVLQWQSSLGAV